MQKDYYLTRRELQIIEYLKKNKFDIITNNILKFIVPSLQNRQQILSRLSKKGKLIRIKNDCYILSDSDLMLIATKLYPGYLCLDSALYNYNLLEYENFSIKIATKNIRKKYVVGKYSLNYIPFYNWFFWFSEQFGKVVSTIEKTIIDCFLFSNHISYQVIFKALIDLNTKDFNWEYFLELTKKLSNSDKQRIGYMLELASKYNKIPKYVILSLKSEKKSKIRLISNLMHTGKYNSEWMVTDNVELYRYLE